MKEKRDLRIIKTKRALYDALVILMENKAFEEIKISDICDEALINRSTFYAHYEDKYELLLELIDEQKRILISDLKKNEKDVNTKEYFMKMLEIVIDNADQNRTIYSAILQSNKNGILIDILMDVAEKDIKERIDTRNDTKENVIPTDFISKFYLGAILSLALSFINNNKYSKEEVLMYLDKLLPNEII